MYVTKALKGWKTKIKAEDLHQLQASRHDLQDEDRQANQRS